MWGKAQALLGSFYRAPFVVPYWDRQELKLILKTVYDSRTGGQEERSRCVESFCRFIGVRHGIATNLGRSAIELALRGLGLGPGDEVILPTFACRGVVLPVIKAGCTPVLVDVEEDFNLGPQSVEEHLTERTRAVIVIHLSGKVAKIDQIQNLVQDKGIFLIEDACQATGGKHHGRFLGTLGEAGIFSFGMGKNIMATSGGMVVTDSSDLYESMTEIELTDEQPPEIKQRALSRLVRCRLRRYSAPFYLIKDRLMTSSVSPVMHGGGYEMRAMSGLDASLLSLQLEKLEEIIARRQANARLLGRELATVEEIVAPAFEDDHIFTKFVIALREGVRPPLPQHHCSELGRFVKFCRRKGVELENTYIPLHLRDGLEQYARRPLPVAEDLYWRAISLPVQPYLGEREMRYVGQTVRSYFQEAARAG